MLITLYLKCRFMKPLLTNCRPTLMETLPKCCLPFARIFTTDEQISQVNL